MDYIYNILSETNNDCKFCETIQKSKYSEMNNISDTITYRNFLFCILDNFDLILSSSGDKKINFPKRIFEICSQIEEDKEHYYDNFNYHKQFSIKKIQNSLQLCTNKGKLLSTIFFLNDYFSTHFVVVDVQKKEYLETTYKNYPKKYLECDNKYYKLSDSIPDEYIKKDNSNLFETDIKMIYNSYLKAIGNYKVEELKGICNELNLSYYEGTKIMKKKDIYDMINLHKLNLI